MDQENPFLDAGAKYDAMYASTLKDLLAQFEGVGVGQDGDGNNAVVNPEDDEIGALYQKASESTKPLIIMMNAILVVRAAQKQGISLEDVFVGAERQKLVAAVLQSGGLSSEADAANFKYKLGNLFRAYQEMPTLLDPILPDLVEPLMKLVQIYTKKACAEGDHCVPPEMSHLFESLQILCNVRGHKTVVKFFPHEVADLEPCVELLHFQQVGQVDQIQGAAATNEHWVPAMLTLWLSMIVLVPFDIQTIDSKKEGDSYDILVKRIINIGAEHISNSGKLREYCAVLLSKLLTRPDVIKQGETDRILKDLGTSFAECKDDTQQMFRVSGILQTLVEIFKIGHRDDFLPRIDLVFEQVLQSEITNKFMAKSTIIRKNKVKLAQRIGCIFLKPKVASWRYKRGSRTLSHLMQADQAQSTAKDDEEEEMLDEDDINFDQLEAIIQLLLEALKDEDNVVRWSAAKGLGRITQRLTKDFADQIVEQLHDLFSETETDSSWHGGCLALAELCRRGLLLPERLDSYVTVLDKALLYDINRGNHSVGAHVRDSACYVVWSFARAYAPEIMKPHVHSLSTKLVILSLFDREVNCRRAASATFQECVGRQGNFPHGIEILTEADYFTLSNRTNAYLNVSCFVGQFAEYFEEMVAHLAFNKLQHWEPAMRVIAAQSLSVLCIFNPALIVEKILIPLIEKCFSKALHIRHGAILGVGEILIGLSGNSSINRKEVLERAYKTLSVKERKMIEQSDNQQTFKEKYEVEQKKNVVDEAMPEGSDVSNSVKGIIARIEKERLYKGKGGEIMRGGVCHLIFSMSMAGLRLDSALLLSFFNTMVENFKHPNQEIQDEAARAFRIFCETYFQKAEEQPESDQIVAESSQMILDEVKKMFKISINDQNIAITRGFNMAFGNLSKSLLESLNQEVVATLITNAVPKNTEADDAETRKQAVRSLVQVVETIGIKNVAPEQRLAILETLYRGYEDYAIDKRGDVGSWVRQESMIQLLKFVDLAVSSEDQELISGLGADQSAFYEKYISQNLQQLNEKIDRIREHAGRCLQKFFKFVAPRVAVGYSAKDELVSLFVSYELEGFENESSAMEGGIAFLPWRKPQFVFNSIQPFFDQEAYSISILKGLITSSGGLTESTLKASQNTLFEYLSKMSEIKNENGELDKAATIAKKKQFIGKLCTIYEQNQKVDRVTVPLMKTVENLLGTDYLTDEELQEDLMEIHRLSVAECNKSKNIHKLLAGVGVFAGLMNSSNVELAKKAIKTILFLLYHNFPKVRQLAAEKLYTGLMAMEDHSALIPGGDDAYEEFDEMITVTDWSQDVKLLTAETKVQMYGFFGHEVKAAKPKQ